MRILYGILCAMIINMGCSAEQPFSPLPQEVAARVANRIVEDTTFSFKPSLPRASDEGYYYLDFYDALGGSDRGLYYARADILVKEAVPGLPNDALATVRLGISHSAGDVEIKLDGKVIYRKQQNQLILPNGLDYDRFIPADYVNISLPENSRHRLAIKMAPAKARDARLWVGFFAKSGAHLAHSITLKPPLLKAAPDYLHFLIAGPVDAAEGGRHPLEAESLNFSVDYEGVGGRKIRWDLPRIHLYRKTC